MKQSHAAHDKLIDRTRQVWQPRFAPGFFAILAEWSRAEMPVPANDMGKPSTSDAGEARDDR